MISLRKHIDTWRDPLAEASLEAYRMALRAMADSSEKAVPGLGRNLGASLGDELFQALGKPVSPEVVSATSARVKQELAEWAQAASEHHADNIREIREIIQVVARTGESVVSRDERYSRQITDLNGRLRAIADLRELPVIRRSILESTRELKTCVEKMAEEGRVSVKELTAEIAVYRTRLEEAERQSATDPLTLLANRRGFQRALENKMEAKQNFSLLMADLNDFKAVNDLHGHQAGDDLLRQFAGELKAQFRPGDLVGRWGGDEFVAIIAAGRPDADICVERIQKWVLGDYKLKIGEKQVRIALDASIGVVQWTGGETTEQLLHRADAAAYAAKPASKRRSTDQPPRENGSPAGSTRESDPAAVRR